MRKSFSYLIITVISLCCFSGSPAQNKNEGKIKRKTEKNCKAFVSGRLLNSPKPFYPNEAKFGDIGGKIEIAVGIDKRGNVTSIESVNGDVRLVSFAVDAAKQAIFTPSVCEGKAADTIGIIVYNFVPTPLRSQIFYPLKFEEFSDITSRSYFFEEALFLSDNYQILFSMADGKYHGEMALTRGDLVIFLAKTLEMLQKRAALTGKNIYELSLFNGYNPFNSPGISFNSASPHSESIKILSGKYKIVFVNENGEFEGDTELSLEEINDIWLQIFGIEAIPVNFLNPQTDPIENRKMTRGDFAIYLKESLDVLTYKLLP